MKMKKCPKCKAEIQEEARFCLYCMTSLEEKHPSKTINEQDKRWLIVAIVAVFIAIAFCILFFVSNTTPSESSGQESVVSSDIVSLPESNTASIAETSQQSDTTSEDVSQQSLVSSKTEISSNDNSSKEVSSDEDYSNKEVSSEEDYSSKEVSSEEDYSSKENSSVSVSSEDTQSTTTPVVIEPKYSYIPATMENVYPIRYANPPDLSNVVVITKVEYIEPSGNYVVPEYIDGKKVAAIMPYAFTDDEISPTVKSVSLPATVKSIWNNAFSGCYNLTDLYLKSRAVEIYIDTFPAVSERSGVLTFHCSRDCRDFNYYYYRNISDKFDALYEEWNG